MINTVDTAGLRTGAIGKLAAHHGGVLHEALSIFIFNQRGQLLLQQRAPGKYHSAGLWTNTCCSHARVDEDVADAAARRLTEEMGFSCPLAEVFTFTYRADVGGGLTEHEFDHVFVGTWDGAPTPDPAEAAAWRWVSLPDLAAEAAAHPERFTAWLLILLRAQRLEELAAASRTL